MEGRITEKLLVSYEEYLIQKEYARGSVEKYLRDIRGFLRWAGERTLTKELTMGWKEELIQKGYVPVTINSMLSSLNGILGFLGAEEFKLRFLKVQRRMFRDQERELSREEYVRLLAAAQKKGNLRLELLLETICATGIRVSEVRHITVEAAAQGRACISLKGKVRTILIPAKLARKLSRYCRKRSIRSGEIFLTKKGSPLSRRQIWGEMKQLCAEAGVEASKVFPHNLRHLFARTYYKVYRDIAKLADILGHSSVETTRIYLISTGAEHARQIEQLGLVS